MKVIKNIKEMQSIADTLQQDGKTIGFVPTMGFLHKGHLSLINESKSKSDVTVVSIYVNPTQFGPTEDFEQYPRNFERDEKLCKDSGVDILFYPDNDQMYLPGHVTFIKTEEISKKLCGISRPDHFQGVTTIVAKLFNIVKPNIAIFGQKDAQQCIIIKRMIEDLNYDINIYIAPTVRENDGLAMSSRNKYLSKEQRKNAAKIFATLSNAKKLISSGINQTKVIFDSIENDLTSVLNLRIDYISIVNMDNLNPVDKITSNTLIALAVYIGNTRLIDNIIIN